MDVTADKLVKVYIKMRDKRAEIKASFEAEDAVIREQMDLVESSLLEICKTAGADSIKTKNGTAYRSVHTRYWPSDWDAMYKFIKEHAAPDLLERRVSQRNMKDFLEHNPDTMPVGLNIDRKYTVNIRRS